MTTKAIATTRRATRAAITSYLTLTMMFVAALAGSLLQRAGGKGSDRGPSTLEYVIMAGIVAVAAIAAGAVVVQKIQSRADSIPD